MKAQMRHDLAVITAPEDATVLELAHRPAGSVLREAETLMRLVPTHAPLLFEVQIDTKKNEPRILEKKQIAWEAPRGTQVTLEVEGRYQKGRASVDEYVEQTIIANPHVKLTYVTPEGETVDFFTVTRTRYTEVFQAVLYEYVQVDLVAQKVGNSPLCRLGKVTFLSHLAMLGS